MGTRADFYIKKADEKELFWLASIAWDGYPDGIDDDVLRAKTPTKFKNALTRFLSARKDTTLPKDGWPWPWDDSNTTDYAYCFIGGKVYANYFGHGWHNPFSKADEPKILWVHPYPNMKLKKNVRYDEGSGLIIVQSKSLTP